jgi:GDP-4-dehydro-6-deoxy-D-mannose reductase
VAARSITALVTGATGFAGRHLVELLLAETSWDVIGLSTSTTRVDDRLRILACDLRDASLVQRVVARHLPDVIFHLAAQSYVPKAFASPADTFVTNVVGQLNLLEACRAASIDPTILIVGSAEEYGQVEPDELPIRETQPFRPVNPYAVSKIGQDMLGLQYWLSYDMRIVRVRPFNHVGPGQSDRFVLSSFARQIADAERGRVEPVVLVGNLDARRDFLDVRDVARAYVLVVRHAQPGDVFNVALGQAQRVGDLLERLVAMARVPITVQIDPTRVRPLDIPVFVGDASRLRAATGWAPRMSIDTTLADVLDYWRANPR